MNYPLSLLHIEDDIITPKSNRLVIFSPQLNHCVDQVLYDQFSTVVLKYHNIHISQCVRKDINIFSIDVNIYVDIYLLTVERTPNISKI